MFFGVAFIVPDLNMTEPLCVEYKPHPQVFMHATSNIFEIETFYKVLLIKLHVTLITGGVAAMLCVCA